MFQVYEITHFSKEKKPKKLVLYGESPQMSKGYVKDGSILICIYEEGAKECFKLSLGEASGLRDNLRLLTQRLFMKGQDLHINKQNKS